MKVQYILNVVAATYVTGKHVRSKKKSPLIKKSPRAPPNHVDSYALNGISEGPLEDPSLISQYSDSFFRQGEIDSGFLSTGCFNNDLFLYNNNDKMTCRWIRWKEDRRISLCEDVSVRINCPQTCGLCCEDDLNYQFKVNGFNSFDCVSIAEEIEHRDEICNSYSNRRMVRDGCPVTCNFCQEFVPEHIPTNTPSIVSTSSYLSNTACMDNSSYQSPLGGHCGCSLFEATDCMKWSVFLTDVQITELMQNCPVACGVCSVSNNPSLSPTNVPTIESDELHCKDNEDYLSPINPKYGCELYSGTDCFIWSPFLNVSQFQDLLIQCPESCGIDCIDFQSPTNSGTSEPSKVIPLHPSASPAGEPSLSPTMYPSNFPSSRPTVEPTSKPSYGPSSVPSLKPSELPSASPTGEPSLSPTLHPSVGPSSSPIVEPTSKPSYDPSPVPSSISHTVSTKNPSPNYSNHPSMTDSIFPSYSPLPLNCSDDESYRSPINPNFGCEIYCGTNCTIWGVILDSFQLAEAFTRCPNTCDLRCIGEVQPIHTNTPTQSPEETNNSHWPSSNPSLSSMHPGYISNGSTLEPSPSSSSSASPAALITNPPSSIPKMSMQPTSFNEFVTSSHPSIVVPCEMSYDLRSSMIMSIVQEISNLNLLTDMTSPQGKALDWLINKDAAFLCPDEPKLIQRYVLAVLYYSTNGENWFQCSASSVIGDDCGKEEPFVNKTHFLDESNECLWAGIRCSETQCVTQIEFEANNLEGTIPTEISYLEDLEFLGMERGQLVGTIPASISNLNKLFFLDLDFNSLTGNIPNDLFMLTNLKQLDLNNNQLSGDIEGIQQLKRLEFLQLHHNKFSGIIPQEISDMTNLRVFTTYGNNFDNAPSSLCMNRDVNGGNLTTYIADCSPICPCCSSMFCG